MLGESKIFIDDQGCSNKEQYKLYQGTLYHVFNSFFHISQFVVCVQHHQLLVTNKSEVMGRGRSSSTCSSEKFAHAVALADMPVTVKDISEDTMMTSQGSDTVTSIFKCNSFNTTTSLRLLKMA